MEELTQQKANYLMEIEKIRINDHEYSLPPCGSKINIPLTSIDEREEFFLDIGKYGWFSLLKVTYQERVRKSIVLVRLDYSDTNEFRTHRNPDGTELFGTHLHTYREGYEDRWAIELPNENFPEADDYWQLLEDFMKYCNIRKPPFLNKGLFDVNPGK